MPVVSCTQDREALTLTLVTEHAAPPDRVWQVWSDPRQLERWWGPPTWPATFEQHDLRPGGEAHYVMTGPEGEKARGWWRILSLEAPTSLEFEDGFSDDVGTPNLQMPTTRAQVRLEEHGAGTRMTVTSTFATLEELEKLAAMGMADGITQAAGQIDALL
jgi:uncharacterized protein YndB with AHSA1/START domain